MTPLKIFKIKPEERIQSAIALIVIIALNALFIYRMHELFMQLAFECLEIRTKTWLHK